MTIVVCIGVIVALVASFTAGASFAIMWYERCHARFTMLELLRTVAVSFFLWPWALAAFFMYTSGPGCGGSGKH